MKPRKIINMMAYNVMWMSILSYMIVTFTYSSQVKEIVSKLCSFIFPTFVFISFWHIQLKRKNGEITLPKFYLKVCLNIILPYFVCLVPYMIYDSNMDFIKTIISGNNMAQFTYLKTLIELCIIYPIMEYWGKRTANFTIISTLIISIVFRLFNFSAYIHTEVFEYLIFAVIGICFALYEKKANAFLRKNKKRIPICIVEFSILMLFTIFFKEYSLFSSPIAILYSLSIMLGICYVCYKFKVYYQDLRYLGRGYIFDFFLFNPAVVLVSFILLLPILARILYDFFSSFTISADVFNYITLLIAIAIFTVSKFSIDSYNKKHKEELFCKKERW